MKIQCLYLLYCTFVIMCATGATLIAVLVTLVLEQGAKVNIGHHRQSCPFMLIIIIDESRGQSLLTM